MVYITKNDAEAAVTGREREVLAELGIKLPPGRWRKIHCPLGTHPDHNPSFRWNDAIGIAHCSCGHYNIFQVVERVRGCGFDDAKLFACRAIGRHDLIRGQDDGWYHQSKPTRPAPTPRLPAPDSSHNLSLAKALWAEAVPINGTLAETYLIRRRIDVTALPVEIDRTLRFHPDCPFGPGLKDPCLLALFTDAVTAEPKGIHRIALTRDGDKIDRKMLGPTRDCVIRLWPDDTVEHGLVIGEGIETTLAAATRIDRKDGTLLRPAWAAGSSGNMSNFPVLGGIDALTLLVDNDPAGWKAASECAVRWRGADRDVIRLIVGRDGNDFNDVVLGVAS